MHAAKIIATLGPKAGDDAAIDALARAGANAFRINLSYDNRDTHDSMVQALRAVEAQRGVSICLIADVSGPRFRIGRFANTQVDLEVGQTFYLDQDETPGDASRVCLPAIEAYLGTSIGDLLRLDDGRVVLRVVKTSPVALTCRVVAGTQLSSHKIISLPRVTPRRPHLDATDREQINWAREAGVDWLSVSWPHRAGMWNETRALAGNMKLLAKVESSACLQSVDSVIAAADGLVIARGDLGYDLPAEEIPGWQKRLVRAARRAGKPVIIAAQMLESMVESPIPTRAEASDVANAVKDGADALMLSAETAVGAYGQEAVALMASVIARAESDQQATLYKIDTVPTIASTIASAAATVADALKAPLIFCFTTTGSTALSVAQTRPKTTIICVSDDVQTLRQMQLVWGLKCMAAPTLERWRDVVDTAVGLAKGLDITPGDPLVITAGMPFGTMGSTNILRVATAR